MLAAIMHQTGPSMNEKGGQLLTLVGTRVRNLREVYRITGVLIMRL